MDREVTPVLCGLGEHSTIKVHRLLQQIWTVIILIFFFFLVLNYPVQNDIFAF